MTSYTTILGARTDQVFSRKSEGRSKRGVTLTTYSYADPKSMHTFSGELVRAYNDGERLLEDIKAIVATTLALPDDTRDEVRHKIYSLADNLDGLKSAYKACRKCLSSRIFRNSSSFSSTPVSINQQIRIVEAAMYKTGIKPLPSD